MKQVMLTSLLFLLYFPSIGQTKSVDISKVNTTAQAETFIQTHPKSEANLFSIEPGQDLAEISPNVFNKKLGFTFKIGAYTYKIISVDSMLSLRVSYIYLDGAKYSKSEIDQIRQEIISEYKSGVPFTNLVRKYNMDGNKTGDTNWFSEGSMVEEFEKGVKSHKKGDIFMINTPTKNWYHVVLKTHNDIYKKNLKILKVKSSS